MLLFLVQNERKEMESAIGHLNVIDDVDNEDFNLKDGSGNLSNVSWNIPFMDSFGISIHPLTGTLVCGKIYAGLRPSEVILLSDDVAIVLIYLYSRTDIKTRVLKVLIDIYMKHAGSGKIIDDVNSFLDPYLADITLREFSFENWLNTVSQVLIL